ncbi:MAG: LacI family DNA-binding transcriptional regulator [Cetobacterium sp.]
MNIKEIAKLANVSVATISRVINNDQKVAITTKEKVLAVMKQFNYSPNSHAIRLSKGVPDQIVGLIVPDIGNILFSEMVEVISNCAEKEKITILLCNTNGEYEKEKKFTELLIDYRVKGVIYIPGKYEDDNCYKFLEELEIHNIPLVFLDREIKKLNFDGVFLDNYTTSYHLTKELLKKKSKKIYFISGNLNVSSGQERFLGFKKAILDFNDTFIDYEISYGNFKFESGYKLGEDILKNHKDEELTIYIANNAMALGFLKSYKKYSKKFKKIAIGVFGTSDVLDMLLDEENHITCKVPNKEIAKKSFQILLQKINNPIQKYENRKKILYSSIIMNRLNNK